MEKSEYKEGLFMINIIRVGRERLREAYEIVNKVDQGMNVPEWFVAETYEEFDFWMKKERGLLYLAVDEEGKAGAMFFVILQSAERLPTPVNDSFLRSLSGFTVI